MPAKLCTGDLLRHDKFRRLLRDVVARVVAAREELEIDDGAAARAILSDLEDDLVVLLERGPLR
jgi:hypothetical protein